MPLSLIDNVMKWRSKLFRAIEINPTELCNFTCSFCPRAHGYPNVNQHMSIETIDLMISQLDEMPNLKRIYVAGRGEPTLHKHFEYLSNKLAEVAKGRIRLHLATNGKWMDKYEECIRRYSEVKLSIYDETTYTIEDAAKKYNSWGNVKYADRRTAGIESGDLPNTYHNRAGSVISEVTKVDNIAHPEYGLMCEKPFDIVYIDWNGDYNLCCNDWLDIQVLGNMYTESLGKYITENERLKEYQKDLWTRQRSLNPCASCNRSLLDKWVRWTDKKILDEPWSD